MTLGPMNDVSWYLVHVVNHARECLLPDAYEVLMHAEGERGTGPGESQKIEVYLACCRENLQCLCR